MRACVVVLLMCAASSIGRADAPLSEKERTARARAHFEMGRARFNLGEYEEAVREFEAGYREKPQPLFLYNIGNAARRAGQNDKALKMFERYLGERPDAPERKEVLARIDELRHEIAQTPPAAPSPEPIAVVSSPAPAFTAGVAPPPAPLFIVAAPQNPPPPRARPSWRRDWLGATLCALGGTTILIGAIDFGVYYPAYDRFASARTLQAHNDAYSAAHDAAPHLDADVYLMPIGAILVAAGAIRYAIVARRR